MIHPLGTREAYEFHLDEARYTRWFRDMMGLGIIAATAAVNFTEELSRNQHISYSASGIALAGITAGMFELSRRGSIKDAKKDAAIAIAQAKVDRLPPPEWAQRV